MSGRLWRVVAALVLVGALTGPVAARPVAASSARVIAANMQFTPARLEVSIGDTVAWAAEDDDHTVTARDGSFDSSDRGLMASGDDFRWRFRAPGTYPYFCRVHGNRGMQGVIVVVDPSAPSTTATSTRPVPVTAAATTSTTLGGITSTTAPATTTTTRPLATSSTTSIAMATPSTTLIGTPEVPQAPPALNPAAPVLGTGRGGDQGLSASEAASRRSSGSGNAAVAVAAALGALVVLGGVGGGLRRRARRRRTG
jgi:plastocyanin